jgi:hypothetical protein
MHDAGALLHEVRREVDDVVEEISQAVEEIESGEPTSAEALLGEAITRLRLLAQRLDEHATGA